ncbi:MAG: ABC transporter ATP-binding protein [Oscillospiraceae bacterium]|nr:ABC transporter ATP-binding protein [Oscillospiraceae bacterium]
MKNIVKIDNLTKKFGDFTALDGVNLELKKGEILGFIGPNGAGKTTTIRCLLGILQATKGTVTAFEKDAWKNAVEIHEKIVYVPGDVNLWDNLTGGEVIDLFIKLQGSKNKKKKEELIKRFDFDPSKKCGTYSKGNRQKVALIAAFASDAELYILDEPTSGLDPLMGLVFKECVLDLKKQGKTVLLSSHILSEVEELCNNISIIRNGKIIETGTLDELRHLKRTRVKIETKDHIKDLKIKNIHDIEQNGNIIEFTVDSSELAKAISSLDKYEITNLVCVPPSLEELFMTHYKGGEG